MTQQQQPPCENCGQPAEYSAYHTEGGHVYVCRDCLTTHPRDHQDASKIWPPKQRKQGNRMSTPAPDYGEPWHHSAHLASLNATIERWESELSAAMPPDFNDWHENAKSEWPEVARRVIESLRDREEWALNALKQQAAALESAIALISRVSTSAATPNDAWEWLKQHNLDRYGRIKR